MIHVNARFRTQRITGVQRYAAEVCDRLGDRCVEIVPDGLLEGVKAHLWEQAVLPFRARGGLLWNPCATGPILRRSVVTVHDLSFLDHPEWFSRSFGGLYRAIVPLLAEKAHHVICVSEHTRERLLHWTRVDPRRTSVVPLAPTMCPTILSADERDAFLAKHDLVGKRILLSVCSLEPRKNLSRLLRSWQQVQPRLDPDCRIVIAGGRGRLAVFAATNLDELPAGVVATGYVADAELRFLYESAEAFIYASLYEGFGLPPLEAMQFGCPVLVSNTTSLPEVVGDAGHYLDPLSESSIGAAIEHAFSDSRWRRDMAFRGRLQAARFSWDECAGSVASILERFQ